MKKKILSILLLSLIITSLIGCGGNTTGSTDSASQTSNKTSEDKKEDAISFSNILITSQSGMTFISGEAKSNDGKSHTFTIKVSFYDKDKKLLGTANGCINNLGTTDSKIFTTMSNGDYSNSDSYKIEVGTMINSSTSDGASKIEFSNLVAKNNSGFTTVDGEVKNNDEKDHSFTIIIGFYDKNNKLIGTATGLMNGLPAGATKTYSAMATGDFSKAASTKVQVDSLVQ